MIIYNILTPAKSFRKVLQAFKRGNAAKKKAERVLEIL
jgi:hypothetical protein